MVYLRKDPHEIFAWPVNDLIAPGYSELIDHPMDFTTIRKKINQSNYASVNEFKVEDMIFRNFQNFNLIDIKKACHDMI